jgi:hypothetical protein
MTEVDLTKFEQEWVGLAEEIVNRVFANSDVQRIKEQLRKNGSLTWEEKSEFIVITDQIKNDLINERYGKEDSKTYQNFLINWQEWQKQRGRRRDKAANLFEENINHFLYGSTPDPEEFLKEFDINNK